MTMKKNEIRRAMVAIRPSIAQRLNDAFHESTRRGKSAVWMMIRELSKMVREKNGFNSFALLACVDAWQTQSQVADVSMKACDWVVLTGLATLLLLLLVGLIAFACMPQKPSNLANKREDW